MRAFLSLVARFRSDERGAFLVIFGILAIVLVATSGAVVDYTAIEQARTRAQVALDTASLGLQPSIYATSTSELTTDAQNLLIQQLGTGGQTWSVCTSQAIPPCAQIDSLVADTSAGTLHIEASIKVPTSFVSLLGISDVTARLVSETTRGSVDVEVAVALDITGSMSGSKITDLKTATNDLIDIIVNDVQTPTYSKVALAPYSVGVNVGSYAAAVRGPVPAAKAITGAAWAVTGSNRGISAVTKASPAKVTTSSAHGYATGDEVYITGVSGMWQLNNKVYTITKTSSTQFTLNGVNSTWYNTYSSSSGDSVSKCQTATCEVVITSAGHGFANGDYVYITGVNGMTQLNNRVLPIEDVATSSFTLKDVVGTSYSTYSSGGSADCTKMGCKYYLFQNANLGWNTWPISTCATDRTTNQWTDTAPSTTYLNPHYASSTGSCPTPTIVPLSDSKTALKASVSSFSAGGSTAGQIGLAWAWYLLSPEFAYLWPTASQPAAYDEPNLMKVLILMTDGEFNTTYCNGVLSKDSGFGNGSSHINCNAPNGDGWTHAMQLCDAIKATGIKLYTVGFDIAGNQTLQDLMSDCSSGAGYAYVADSGTDLKTAFKEIAQNISALRLSR